MRGLLLCALCFFAFGSEGQPLLSLTRTQEYGSEGFRIEKPSGSADMKLAKLTNSRVIDTRKLSPETFRTVEDALRTIEATGGAAAKIDDCSDVLRIERAKAKAREVCLSKSAALRRTYSSLVFDLMLYLAEER